MRIVTIVGNHRRHLYYVNRILQDFDIAGCLILERESMMPKPPSSMGAIDKKNFLKHFKDREQLEKKYFGEQELPNCRTIMVNENTLSSAKSVNFIRSIKPNVVLIFGTTLIRDPLYSVLPRQTINLHLGLSPRYRGSATLFWPFYFLEPTYAGATFHYIISEPDAGDIIHQVVPRLEKTDGIHDVACKTVIEASEEAVRLLKIFGLKRSWKSFSQKGTGKNFLQKDFKVQHLRVIYNLYNNDIVKQYLEGKLKSAKPHLVLQEGA